jgi:hypothetical protein
MKIRVRLNRFNEIKRIRGKLELDGLPRLQMTLLVALTGLAGFVASYILLRTGFVVMWTRYLLSFGLAYLIFLVLLWVWLRSSSDDYVDIGDLANAIPSPADTGNTAMDYSRGGGGFGGGGASSSFDAPGDGCAVGDGVGEVIGEAVSGVAQAEEFAIPLFAIIFILSLLLSTFFMVYSAPALFAELLVDGVLSASLYHRFRGLETRHWLETAIRRTAWPFLLTALTVSALAWIFSLYMPGIHSIGEVLYYSY